MGLGIHGRRIEMEYLIIAIGIVMLAAGIRLYGNIRERQLLKSLNEMLEKARNGEFSLEQVDETMLSSVENSMARFLEDSKRVKKDLSQQKQRIQTMISDIFHQTAIPVSNILVYSQLLEEGCEDPQLRENAALIRQQAEKLKFLLDALVKISRLETGIIRTVPEKTDVRDLVRKVQALMEQKAQKQGILFTAETGEEPVYAWFDEKWTVEALCNLVDNAVKYTPSGGKVTLEIILYPMYCRINVCDTGMGIRKEELPEIFSRFYRSREVLTEEGVGLGLYLAREIVRNEGGYMKVSSEKGKGSTFSVFLPTEKQKNVSRL